MVFAILYAAFFVGLAAVGLPTSVEWPPPRWAPVESAVVGASLGPGGRDLVIDTSEEGRFLRQGGEWSPLPDDARLAWSDDGALLVWAESLWRYEPDGRRLRIDAPECAPWNAHLVAGRGRLALICGTTVWLADQRGRRPRTVELPQSAVAYGDFTGWFTASGAVRFATYDVNTCGSSDRPELEQVTAVTAEGRVLDLGWPAEPVNYLPDILGNAGGWIYLAPCCDSVAQGYRPDGGDVEWVPLEGGPAVYGYRPGLPPRRLLEGEVSVVGQGKDLLFVRRGDLLFGLRGAAVFPLGTAPQGLLAVGGDERRPVAVTDRGVLRRAPAAGWVRLP